MSDSNSSIPLTKTLRLEFKYPENIESKFATEVMVQHQKDYVVLSFFEAIMPPLLGTTEDEKSKLLEKLDRVEAKCISRIILTPEKFKSTLHMMSSNLEKWEKSFKFNKEGVKN